MTFPEFQHPGIFSPGCFGGSDEFSGMLDCVIKKPGCEPFVEKKLRDVLFLEHFHRKLLFLEKNIEN